MAFTLLGSRLLPGPRLTHRLDVGLYVIAFCLFLGALLVVVVVPVNLADAIARKNGTDGPQDRPDARRTGR